MYNKSIIESCQTEVDTSFLPRKQQSLILSEAYSYLGAASRSHRVECCGSFLEFHISDEIKLHNANFCKDRLCPMCNWRRSKKIFAQVSKVMDVLQTQSYRFVFLTLTVKNCDFSELEDTVSNLLDGWRNLYRNKFFKNAVKGSFRTLEITVNKKNKTFHPHLHCILAVNESYFVDDRIYLSQKKWSELWEKACNLDYMPVVDVRTVKTGKFELLEGNTKTYKSAIKELSKYVAKGSDYLSGDISEIIVKVSHLMDALSSRRLCSMTGVFKDVQKNLNLDDVEDGDLVHTETDIRSDISFMIVRYHWKSGFYDSEIVGMI